ALGSFSEVAAGPWTVNVNWGDSSSLPPFQVSTQGGLPSASHTYADGGIYTVTVTVTDPQGGYDSQTFKVTVANVAPTATINGVPASNLPETPISLTSTVTDPSSIDTATGFILAWSVLKNGASYATGSGSSFTFTPNDFGAYTVTLT